MNKISIAFAVNNAYIEHLLIAIYSLLKNNSKNDVDIYILQQDFTVASRRKLKKLEKHFVNAEITLIDMKDKMHLFRDITTVIDYISIETYFRFMLADLLINLDKILYLDADILVQSDIGELWDTDVNDYYAAGVEDSHILADGYKPKIGFGDNDLYVNAGVLLFNLAKIRIDRKVEELFANVAKHPGIRYQDQDIINITFKRKIKPVNVVNNFMWEYQQWYREKYDDVRIIHYAGKIKPWLSYGLNNRPYWFYIYDECVDEYAREILGETDRRSEKFGLFTYTTENVGDSIQSIAARQFLPQIDYHIDRDSIDGTNYENAKNVKLIMNGWYTHHPENWPPLNKKINPLLISMYFASEYSERTKKAVLSDISKDFFKRNNPVGVRDLSTKKFFQQHKIDNYFSGCLTLTIQRSPKIKKQDFILAVDVPEAVLEKMKEQTERRIITVSAELMTQDMSPLEQLKIAEWFLSLIQSAHCVVSSRLHAALPSLALETPALFILKDNHRETDRFAGLIELTHSMGESEYIKNPAKYNIDKPPKNSDDYQKLRESLISRCQEFTGFHSRNGFLTQDLPFDISNHDFIQRFFDSLYFAYRYQHLSDILTGKTECANTEIEKHGLYLKSIEQAYPILEQKYNNIVKVPRAIRNKIRLLKGRTNNDKK